MGSIGTVIGALAGVGAAVIFSHVDYNSRLAYHNQQLGEARSLVALHKPYQKATDYMAESMIEFAEVDTAGRFFLETMCLDKSFACEDSSDLEYTPLNYVMNAIDAIHDIKDDDELIEYLESTLSIVEDQIWEFYGWGLMNDSQKERLSGFLQAYVHNLLADTAMKKIEADGAVIEPGWPDSDNLDGEYHSAIEYWVKHGERYLLSHWLEETRVNLRDVAIELYLELDFDARDSLDEKQEYERREIEWQAALRDFQPYREAYNALEFDENGNLAIEMEKVESFRPITPLLLLVYYLGMALFEKSRK